MSIERTTITSGISWWRLLPMSLILPGLFLMTQRLLWTGGAVAVVGVAGLLLAWIARKPFWVERRRETTVRED